MSSTWNYHTVLVFFPIIFVDRLRYVIFPILLDTQFPTYLCYESLALTLVFRKPYYRLFPLFQFKDNTSPRIAALHDAILSKGIYIIFVLVLLFLVITDRIKQAGSSISESKIYPVRVLISQIGRVYTLDKLPAGYALFERPRQSKPIHVCHDCIRSLSP